MPTFDSNLEFKTDAPTSLAAETDQKQAAEEQTQITQVAVGYQEFLTLAKSRNPQVFEILRNNIIGANATFMSPFGLKRIVYADYFASGKSLRMIEDYIQQVVLPTYANTHTEQTHTGKITSEYRAEARNYIKGFVCEEKEDVKVVFAGSGSTACLNKLVSMFRLKEKHVWEQDKSLKDRLKSLFSSKRPVVFISSQEHHANIILWRRGTFADLVFIKNRDGLISLKDLEEKLQKYSNRPLKIGSFTAGSNVVGVLMNTDKISAILHKYGALAIWDYAGVGSYVPIQMNSQTNPLGYKDAVVLSPHKMIGGPQTPGILIIRTDLLRKIHSQKCGNYIPSNVGGGIVDFVDTDQEYWIRSFEEVEEAGTPAIVESIRAGLVFRLKRAVGCQVILSKELEHARTMISRLCKMDNILILGDLKRPRIPVLSFLVKTPKCPGKVFHYNFITALLNDLFGIQSRGGCMCAALFSKELLNIPDEIWGQYKKLSTNSTYDGVKGGPFYSFRPGFTRLSAIEWVCQNAHKIIQKYDYSVKYASWKYCGGSLPIGTQLGRDDVPTQDQLFEYADAIANMEISKQLIFPQEEQLKSAVKKSKRMQELQWYITTIDLQEQK